MALRPGCRINAFFRLQVGGTVRLVLNDYDIVPDPERRLRDDWELFTETRQYSSALTDFAQVERLTTFELIRESLLFFMDINSSKVQLGGQVNMRKRAQMYFSIAGYFELDLMQRISTNLSETSIPR